MDGINLNNGSRKPKVLMILNNPYTYDPRVSSEAEALSEAGYEVKVISWDKSQKYPLRETINGVEVFRIRIPTIFDKIFPFEILKVPIWQVFAYKFALRLYNSWKFEIVHVHDWPDLPPGVWLKKRLGVRLIYDSHEVWTYMIFTRRFPQWLNEVVWRERALIKHVDALITVGNGYKRYFLRYYPKVELVLNAKPRMSTWSRPSTVPLEIVYIGGFGKERCILELLHALDNLGLDNLKAVFAGPPIPGITSVVEEYSKRNKAVKYLGLIPKSDVLKRTMEGSVVYFVFSNQAPLYRIGMPNKLFEAISVGRMALAGAGTDSGRFVQEYKIGLAVECDENKLRNVLKYLAENPKDVIKFSRRAYRIWDGYNWKIESGKLINIYKKLLRGV